MEITHAINGESSHTSMIQLESATAEALPAHYCRPDRSDGEDDEHVGHVTVQTQGDM